MNHKIICGDCLKILPNLPLVDCIFADPPDNIGTKYHGYKDCLAGENYLNWLADCLLIFLHSSNIVWLSFNVKWTIELSRISNEKILREFPNVEIKPCVQIFTFGQHNQHDLANCYRPLWRFRHKDTALYPDQIRTPSWRQINNDKRADPRGRVPSDVFNFPKVTGNSGQRRSWCPTQLHERLVERCIKLSTLEGGTVLDPFAGTGTTLRVCRRINRHCTLIEQSEEYCRLISEEHGLEFQKGETTVTPNKLCRICGGEMIDTPDRYRVCEKGCGRLQPSQ